MWKRLLAALDISVIFVLVSIALAGHQAWRIGFQGPQMAALMSFVPIIASMVAVLLMVVVPHLIDAERMSMSHAITLPLLHGSLTLLFTRMMVTRPNAVIAPNDVVSPIAYWLEPRPLILLVGAEFAILATLTALRGRNQQQPVS